MQLNPCIDIFRKSLKKRKIRFIYRFLLLLKANLLPVLSVAFMIDLSE